MSDGPDLDVKVAIEVRVPPQSPIPKEHVDELAALCARAANAAVGPVIAKYLTDHGYDMIGGQMGPDPEIPVAPNHVCHPECEVHHKP